MLKVTVKTVQRGEIWELEGKLSGDWVRELERCWRARDGRSGTSLQVHMKAVSYIDSSGKLLLAEMHGQGVDIRGGGCVTNAVVEEITRRFSGG